MRATLDVMAQRERPELPEAYWASYRRRLKEDRSERGVSLDEQGGALEERLRRWGRSLSTLLPQTGGQWTLQGAVALLLLAVGL